MQISFTLRQLRKSDVADFLRYESELYAERSGDPNFGQVVEETCPKNNDLKKWFSSLYQSILDRDTIAYVAIIEGRIAGLCTVMREGKWCETSHVGVLGIEVLSKYRNIGLGSALISEVLKKSKKRFEIIECSAFATNKGAIKLYEKFRFKKIGIVPRHIKRGRTYIDNVLLSLRLK